jgi:hypothetical protein
VLTRVTFLEWQTSAADAVAEMMRRGWDIGLAPLVANDFNAAKLPTKYRDYGACGIAGVYSSVEAYLKFVQDGETGLLVENIAAQWAAAIRRLIVDPALRDHIRTMAFLDVRRNHSLEAAVETWRDVLRKARAMHRDPANLPQPSVQASAREGGETTKPVVAIRTSGDETMRAQAKAFYAHHQRVWRYSAFRLVYALRKAIVGREPREPLGPELRALIERNRTAGIAGDRCRLRLGENLQNCTYVEYPLLPCQGTFTSAVVGMWLPLLRLGGAFGIEIVSGDERIVLNKRVDLAELAPEGVVHFHFPPLVIGNAQGWRMRVFAVDSPVPVHVYEWMPVGRGRRQPRCLYAMGND